MMWSIEQIPQVRKFVIAEVPYVEITPLHELCPIASVRNRAIISSHPLDFEPYQRERKQDLLADGTAHPKLKGKRAIVVSPSGHMRDASASTHTVTSGPLRVGEHVSDTEKMDFGIVEKLLGADDGFDWPQDLSETKNRRQYHAQIVPPAAMAKIMVSVHNIVPKDRPPVMSQLEEDVIIPHWDPYLYLKALPEKYRLNERTSSR